MKTYINEIKENGNVDSFFLVKEKSSGITRTGNAYLKLRLVDCTGEMEGRIWASVETFVNSFEKDDFVHAKGKASSYQEHLQLSISHIEKLDEDTILLSDFFPVAKRDIEGMFNSLMENSQQVRIHILASFSTSSGRMNCLSNNLKWSPLPNGFTMRIWEVS
jgi:3'-5' exoribonuclease